MGACMSYQATDEISGTYIPWGGRPVSPQEESLRIG